MSSKSTLKILIGLLPALIVVLLPHSIFPFEITVMQQRSLALFLFAASYWILEPIPVFATSVLVIVIQLLAMSDKGLWFLAQGERSVEEYGAVLDHKSVMANFSSPIIMLFLGGFFLAMAATKYRLDSNLARVLIRPFGNNPKKLLLGLMIATALFSMFMSNTATTAMMLAILSPVLAAFPERDRGRLAYALGIPFAANIGGIGTPIGTPPNAVALKYLTEKYSIDFGEWMMFAVPFVIVMLLFCWQLLIRLFPPEITHIELNLEGKFLKHWKALTVYFTFGVTILLWLLGSLHGMNSYVVAMIPVAVFTATGILSADDVKRVSWDVLWLVSGGIALGAALEQTGTAKVLVEHIPFTYLSPFVVVLAATLVTLLMANFMSHTATANLILPIVSAVAVTLSSLDAIGGKMMLVLGVTFASSLAMSLPISTPPNAMAHASGLFEVKDMLKAGLTVGIVGLLLTYVLLLILFQVDFYPG